MTTKPKTHESRVCAKIGRFAKWIANRAITHESRVCAKIGERRKVGLNKYGVGVERTDLSIVQWLQHAQEEAMDLAVYLERVMDIIVPLENLAKKVKKSRFQRKKGPGT